MTKAESTKTRIETRERQALEKALRRKAGKDADADLSAEKLAQARTKTRQDFHDAARDKSLWKKR